MARWIPTLFVALVAISSSARAEEPGCVTCHKDEDSGWDERIRRPALLVETDVHTPLGVSCTDCHGGRGDTLNFVQAHSKKNGWSRKPTGAAIVDQCAKCHDDAAMMK